MLLRCHEDINQSATIWRTSATHYLWVFGVSLRAVRDDLGKAVDPSVNLVPPPTLHFIVCHPPLLLSRGAAQPGVHDTLGGTWSKIAWWGGGKDVTYHIKLACVSFGDGKGRKLLNVVWCMPHSELLRSFINLIFSDIHMQQATRQHNLLGRWWLFVVWLVTFTPRFCCTKVHLCLFCLSQFCSTSISQCLKNFVLHWHGEFIITMDIHIANFIHIHNQENEKHN